MSDEKDLKKQNISENNEENEYEKVYAVIVSGSYASPEGVWKTFATYEEAEAEADRFNKEQDIISETMDRLEYNFKYCGARVAILKEKKTKEKED